MSKKTSPPAHTAAAASPAGRRAAELQTAMGHHRGGRLTEAEAGYRKLLHAEPDDAAVLRLLALVMMSRGDWARAVELFERALRRRPEMVAAHLGLGSALTAQGKRLEAEAAFERSLALDPQNLEALNNLGNSRLVRRRFTEAATAFRRALAINPRLPELHNNLGNALQGEKKPDEAIGAFREAIALKPDFPEAHSNLGNMLKAQNQLPEAVAAYRRALELRPGYIEALNNLGNALHASGLSSEAIATYRRSQALQPAQGDAYFYESLVHLALGDLAKGFAEYEGRWKSDLRAGRRDFPQPLWLGEPALTGRTLLLHAEQGLGDTLQFVRYAALAVERGATVVLEVQPALQSLLSRFPGVQAVVAKGDPLPAFDLHCPLLSLPHAFRTTLETIPARAPYLSAAAERVAHWRSRLPRGPRGRPRVGLVWAGNPNHNNDRNRSVPLALLRPLFAPGSADFYSLQKDERSADERQLAAALGMVDLAPELGDFDDTAAALAELDLVISVDTSVAHLAGALGRPVWVLLPLNPDWRWLLRRGDSPWYPSMRLFRQERAGDWTRPVAELAAGLAGLAAAGDAGSADNTPQFS